MSLYDMSQNAMFGHPDSESRNNWMSRGVVTIAFLFFGFDKFSDGWIKFFDQLGFGQWFRYFTGVIEILGAILVLIPRTASLGLFILAATMACASLIWIFPMHAPGNSIFTGIILIALLAFWQTQRAG